MNHLRILAHIVFVLWIGLYIVKYLKDFPFEPAFWLSIMMFEAVYWSLDEIISILRKNDRG